MEDEEYVPENSDLRFYLESLNLCDVHREDTVKQKACNFSLPSITKAKSKNNVELIDRDVIEQIEELLSARMLFEEDVNNIERLLANFKVVKVGMLRDIFENVSGFVVIILGLCAYWIIGSYVFFMISVYYAYNAADYLWRKHFNQRRIKHLTEILETNYNLFRKTLKFIKDSDDILKLEGQNKLSSAKGMSGRYENYLNLKKEFAQAESEVITILTKATKKLIDKFPFYDYIEDPNYYLCYRYEQYFMECIDVTKLYQMYLLVQSEFLQRLALSLIPNIKIAGKENSLELYKIIRETSVLMKRLENKLNKKFRYVFLRGICDSEKNLNLNLPKKANLDLKSQYRNELMMNIQDMSNSFQRLLIRSRTIENNFSSEDKPDRMENQLADIQNELNICQRNINDSIIVLKKFSCKETNSVADCDWMQDTAGEEKTNHEMPVDLMAEESQVEDEIFEAHLTGESKTETEDYDFDDFVKKKVEREYSNLVLQELKSKISEKAKEWEVREANALLKKAGKEGLQPCLKDENVLENDLRTNAVDSSEGKEYGEYISDSDSSDEVCKNAVVPPVHTPNSQFLADIFQARAKLMKSPALEECFCDSGEEDEGEDE